MIFLCICLFEPNKRWFGSQILLSVKNVSVSYDGPFFSHELNFLGPATYFKIFYGEALQIPILSQPIATNTPSYVSATTMLPGLLFLVTFSQIVGFN